MNKKLLILISTLFLIVLSGLVSAQPPLELIIDNSGSGDDHNNFYIVAGISECQSFTLTKNLTNVTIEIKSSDVTDVGAGGNYYLALYNHTGTTQGYYLTNSTNGYSGAAIDGLKYLNFTFGSSFVLNQSKIWFCANASDSSGTAWRARVNSGGGYAGGGYDQRGGNEAAAPDYIFRVWGNNYTAPLPPPTYSSLNMSDSSPPSNLQYPFSNLSFAVSGNFSYNFSCGLYINSTLNQTFFNYSPSMGINLIWNKTINDGAWTYYINCSNNETSSQTTAKTFYIDTTAPLFNSSFNGNSTYWTGFLNVSLTLGDVNKYSLNYSDSCGYVYFNNSALNVLNNFTWYIFNCSLGQKQSNITFCDGFNGPLNCITKHFLWSNMAQLNISVVSALTNFSITNFTISLNGTVLGNYNSNHSINNLSLGYYNITIDAPGYAFGSALIYINKTISYYNFSLYTTNSVSFTIRDEITGNLIVQNVTIKFSNNLTEFSNITATGYFYIDNINASIYDLLFTSAGYTPRSYVITVGNRTTQSLDVYLSNSNLTTIFTFMDRDSSELLENSLVTMYKQINGSWVTVESKYSDITGRAQFVYTAYTNYKFYVSKTQYEDYVFYLSPILFSSYDVKLTKISLLNYSMDFDLVAVIYSPQSFNNGAVNAFNFIISSPTGLLTNYGINLTYPGGSVASSGVNAIGEQLNANLNITGASVFDVVTLTYFYTTTTSGTRTFTVTMPIVVNGTTSFNMYRNRDVTFGLGIFERVLMAVLVVIFVVGISALIGQTIAGFALGLMVYVLLCYSGFLPFWTLAAPLLVGILFLIWRTSQ